MGQQPQASVNWKVKWAAALAAVALSAGWTGNVMAQPKPAAGRATTATPHAAPAKASAADLAASAEDQLMGALANREMETLLAHYFKKNNIAPDKQQTVRGAVAIRGLADPKLPAARRRALLVDAVRGVDNFVRSTKDTETLLSVASTMIEYGLKPQANQIEYFGDTPSRQSELNDSATAVKKLLDKTEEECEAQQAAVFANNVRPTPAQLQKWQSLDERLNTARYTRACSAYWLAMSMDPADPKRKEVSDAAIAYLTQLGAPEFQVQLPAKLQIGKLLSLTDRTDDAVKKLDEAFKAAGANKEGQYEVQLAMVLNFITAKRPPQADAALKSLNTWITTNMGEKEAKSMLAGTGLLEFRITEMKAAVSKDPGEQRKFKEQAEAVLARVMKENPSLEPVIKKMLLDRLPANVDVTKVDALLLRSLTVRGVDEYKRAKEGLADEKGKPILQTAVNAALEMEKRKGKPNVTPELVEESVFLAGMFEAKLGEPAAAAELSLRYLKDYGKNPDYKAMALANALSQVEILRKDVAKGVSGQTQQLIDEAWRLAIAAGHKEYTFVYGKRLFDTGKFKEAVTVLKQVPDTHPAVTYARFYLLTAMQELLDDKATDAATKKSLMTEIQKLATEVTQRLDAELAKATSDTQKARFSYFKTSSVLLSADLTQRMAEENKDPKGEEKTLAILTGFEDVAKGQPGEEKLIGQALHLRVKALMSLNRMTEAVADVKKLVESGTPGLGPRILFNMIEQMDKSYRTARAKKDKEGMKESAGIQIALIDPLIQATQKPEIKAAYEEWKADLLLRGVTIESDPAKRSAYLNEAQKTFNKLQPAAQKRMEDAQAATSKFKEGPPATTPALQAEEKKLADEEKEALKKFYGLRYNLAKVSFELGDYKRAQTELGDMIANGRLGPADLTETGPDGDVKYKDNPTYWEGMLRYMQSNVELAKANPNDAELKAALESHRNMLRAYYLDRGNAVGGEQFSADYAKLKAELLPGWNEEEVRAKMKAAGAAPTPATPAPKPAGGAVPDAPK